MSRRKDRKPPKRSHKRAMYLVDCIDFGLYEALDLSGCELLGVAFKVDETACLMTIKAHVSGKFKVAFVAANSMANCFLQAMREIENDELTWRVDKYRH